MNQTLTMQTATIFKKPFDIPENKGDEQEVFFSYSGLRFRLLITPVELGEKIGSLSLRPVFTLNLRLYMNKSISTAIDVKVEEIESNPGRIERIILNQIFSQKMTRQILEGIYN